MAPLDTLVEAVLQRGDLAHLALLAWASGASALLVTTFRELASANRRFDAFVRELALFNRRQKKIVVSGTKTFGPTAYPVPNLGVDRTSTATVTWKLTLVRKK